LGGVCCTLLRWSQCLLLSQGRKKAMANSSSNSSKGASSSGLGLFQRRSIRAPQSPYPSPPISHSVWTNLSYPNS
jgi:hypothetical protein